MLPLDIKPFYTDIQKEWSSLSKERGNPGKNPKDGAERAYAIYRNTYESALPFVVVGADRLRHDTQLVINLGIVTASCPTQTKKSAMQSKTGSILGETQWSVLINDAFMLGGIHAGKDFHLASKRGVFPPLEKLWDESNNQLRPLGRELAILKLAGYKQASKVLACWGMAFSCCTTDLYPPTLAQLRVTLKKINSLREFKNLFKEELKDEEIKKNIESKEFEDNWEYKGLEGNLEDKKAEI